jgi:hypothetical protein
MTDRSEADGVWIFVSHSNLDLDKVRQVRDALEKEGHKPLLFFLKCLNNEDPRLPQLLKDEIKARTWFILCNSDNAEKSPWVREEVEIVTATKPPETFVKIDLTWDLELITRTIRPLLKRATVFFSYAGGDATIATQIYDALVEQDYRVFFDRRSLSPSMDWSRAVVTALEDAVAHGFVLLLLSPEYLTSAWCEKEREWALNALGSKPKSNIVPIIVRDPETVYNSLPADLRNIQCIDTTKGPIVQTVTALLHQLKSRPMI